LRLCLFIFCSFAFVWFGLVWWKSPVALHASCVCACDRWVAGGEFCFVLFFVCLGGGELMTAMPDVRAGEMSEICGVGRRW